MHIAEYLTACEYAGISTIVVKSAASKLNTAAKDEADNIRVMLITHMLRNLHIMTAYANPEKLRILRDVYAETRHRADSKENFIDLVKRAVKECSLEEDMAEEETKCLACASVSEKIIIAVEALERIPKQKEIADMIRSLYIDGTNNTKGEFAEKMNVSIRTLYNRQRAAYLIIADMLLSE